MGSSPQPSEKSSQQSDFPVVIASATFKSIAVSKQKILHRDESQEGNLHAVKEEAEHDNS